MDDEYQVNSCPRTRSVDGDDRIPKEQTYGYLTRRSSNVQEKLPMELDRTRRGHLSMVAEMVGKGGYMVKSICKRKDEREPYRCKNSKSR